MSKNIKTVTVKILGKEYQITCPEGQEASLMDAIYYVDGKMSSIRKSGRIHGLDRIAVMTALNLSHELLTQKKHRNTETETINSRLEQLHDKINQALKENLAKKNEATFS